MAMYEICAQMIEIAMWAKSDMVEVLQNAVYGIAVMSKYLAQAAFQTLLPKAMAAVERVTSLPEAQDEEHICATENAYITLGHLAVFQTKEAAHLDKFMSLLPLSGEAEAQEAHSFLLDHIDVFGRAQAKAALNRISAKYQQDDTILTEEAKQKLDDVLAQM
jgi:hypothetical protein